MGDSRSGQYGLAQQPSQKLSTEPSHISSLSLISITVKYQQVQGGASKAPIDAYGSILLLEAFRRMALSPEQNQADCLKQTPSSKVLHLTAWGQPEAEHSDHPFALHHLDSFW